MLSAAKHLLLFIPLWAPKRNSVVVFRKCPRPSEGIRLREDPEGFVRKVRAQIEVVRDGAEAQ